MSIRRTIVTSLGLLLCAVAGAGCMDQAVARAGPDRTVDAGATVMLDASASTPDRSGALNYAWTVSEGPDVAFLDVHGRTTSFTAPRQGTETRFIIRLDVTYVDFAGQPVPSNTDSDQLVVRVGPDVLRFQHDCFIAMIHPDLFYQPVEKRIRTDQGLARWASVCGTAALGCASSPSGGGWATFSTG